MSSSVLERIIVDIITPQSGILYVPATLVVNGLRANDGSDSISVNNSRLTNLSDPTDPLDAINKRYLDTETSSLTQAFNNAATNIISQSQLYTDTKLIAETGTSIQPFSTRLQQISDLSLPSGSIIIGANNGTIAAQQYGTFTRPVTAPSGTFNNTITIGNVTIQPQTNTQSQYTLKLPTSLPTNVAQKYLTSDTNGNLSFQQLPDISQIISPNGNTSVIADSTNVKVKGPLLLTDNGNTNLIQINNTGTGVDFGSLGLSNVATPLVGNDVATKDYVDSAAMNYFNSRTRRYGPETILPLQPSNNITLINLINNVYENLEYVTKYSYTFDVTVNNTSVESNFSFKLPDQVSNDTTIYQRMERPILEGEVFDSGDGFTKNLYTKSFDVINDTVRIYFQSHSSNTNNPITCRIYFSVDIVPVYATKIQNDLSYSLLGANNSILYNFGFVIVNDFPLQVKLYDYNNPSQYVSLVKDQYTTAQNSPIFNVIYSNYQWVLVNDNNSVNFGQTWLNTSEFKMIPNYVYDAYFDGNGAV